MKLSKHLPAEAYRYWPSPEEVVTGTGKNTVRWFFYNVEFSPYETERLQEFKKALAKQLKEVPSYFGDEELIRLLTATGFDLKAACKAFAESIDAREQGLVHAFLLGPSCTELLEEGSIYLHGVDFKYRPIIILNVARMQLKKYSATDYCGLLCYILEYTINHYMLPGQVENWVIVTDLCKLSLGKLPIKDIKKIIRILQTHFRCRMTVNYIVNAPNAINFLWGMFKGFVDARTVKKLKLSKTVSEEIKTHVMPNQLEAKYGGTVPDLQQFWPPVMPGPPYNFEGGPPEENKSTFRMYNRRDVPRLEHSQSLCKLSEVSSVSACQEASYCEPIYESGTSESSSPSVSRILPSDETVRLESSRKASHKASPRNVFIHSSDTSEQEILASRPSHLEALFRPAEGDSPGNHSPAKSLEVIRRPCKPFSLLNARMAYQEDSLSFEYAAAVRKELAVPEALAAPRKPRRACCVCFWRNR